MEKNKGAVVVGCGAVGPVHAQVIQECEGARLAGVCDIVSERAQRLAEEHGCKVYDSYTQVLMDAEVDAVHLCTPHYLHAPMAREAVKHGKHIVIEKPFAMNLKEAEALGAELLAQQVKVCCILQNRYTPCIQKMKEMIDSGAYGAVKGGRGLLTWQRTPEYYRSEAWRGRWDTEGGGLLINQAVHLLDLMTYLGGECADLSGTIANRTLQDVIEVEDTAEATLYTKTGQILHFFATNGYCANTPFDLEIILENAALRFQDNKLYLHQEDRTEEIATNKVTQKGKAYWGNGHWNLIQAFYHALHGEADTYTSIADGIAAVRLVDGIYRSAKTGKHVSF